MYLSKKEYERLREIKKANETALTFDALELIIKSCDFDAEKIGRHFLEGYLWRNILRKRPDMVDIWLE